MLTADLASSPPARSACLRIPRFALAALLRGAGGDRRSAGDWDARPGGAADEGRLRMVTAAAGRAHVVAGMTVVAARARCPSLAVVPWDDAAIARRVAATGEALRIASPAVAAAPDEPGLWWIPVASAHGGERSLVRTLLRVGRLWHPYPRVAVADSREAAREATWGLAAGGGTITPLHDRIAPFVAIVPQRAGRRAT